MVGGAKREAGDRTAGIVLGKVIGVFPPCPSPQMQEGNRGTHSHERTIRETTRERGRSSPGVSAEAKTKHPPILTSHSTVNYNTLQCLFRWVCYAWLNLKIGLGHHFTLNNIYVREKAIFEFRPR